MSSYFSYGELKFKRIKNQNEDYDYGFGKLELCMEGCAEDYFPQWQQSWGKETVVLKKDGLIIKYNRTIYDKLLFVDENGIELLLDGRTCPGEGKDLSEEHKNLHYLNKTEPAEDYTIEILDTKTLKKKILTVVETEEQPMSEWEIKKYIEGGC